MEEQKIKQEESLTPEELDEVIGGLGTNPLHEAGSALGGLSEEVKSDVANPLYGK